MLRPQTIVVCVRSDEAPQRDRSSKAGRKSVLVVPVNLPFMIFLFDSMDIPTGSVQNQRSMIHDMRR